MRDDVEPLDERSIEPTARLLAGAFRENTAYAYLFPRTPDRQGPLARFFASTPFPPKATARARGNSVEGRDQPGRAADSERGATARPAAVTSSRTASSSVCSRR